MEVVIPENLTKERASDIAELINERNELITKYTDRSLKAYAKDENFRFIIETNEHDELIGVVEVQKVQWYQCEIRHLAVKEKYANQGIGTRLIYAAIQEAIKFNARIAQCTIRRGNDASASVFYKYGFKITSQFANKISGNTVNIFQLDLTQREMLNINVK